MSYSRIEAIERRRRNWRVALITIIIITIPFYCVGVFLWGTAPRRDVTPTPSTPQGLPTGVATATVTQGSTGFPSITPLPITLFPTDLPPTAIPTVTPTRFLSPTPPIVFPTDAPPPTQPPPPITDTPLPFETVGP